MQVQLHCGIQSGHSLEGQSAPTNVDEIASIIWTKLNHYGRGQIQFMPNVTAALVVGGAIPRRKDAMHGRLLRASNEKSTALIKMRAQYSRIVGGLRADVDYKYRLLVWQRIAQFARESLTRFAVVP